MVDRKAQARVICEVVVRRIGEVTPEGLGRWEPCWAMVEEASDRFLDRLRDWELEDTAETRRALELAAGALVQAWKRAGEAYLARELGTGVVSRGEGVAV